MIRYNQNCPPIIFNSVKETSYVTISLCINLFNSFLISHLIVAPFFLMLCIMPEEMPTRIHVMKMRENDICPTIVHKIPQHISLPLAIVIPRWQQATFYNFWIDPRKTRTCWNWPNIFFNLRQERLWMPLCIIVLINCIISDHINLATIWFDIKDLIISCDNKCLTLIILNRIQYPKLSRIFSNQSYNWLVVFLRIVDRNRIINTFCILCY